jgi:hypothetical protein
MDLMTPLFGGALLAIFTAIQAWLSKGRFEAIDRRFDRVETELAALRSDLLQVALSRRDD